MMAGEPLQEASVVSGYDPSWLANRIWLIERPKAPGLPLRVVNPFLAFLPLVLLWYCLGIFLNQRKLDGTIAMITAMLVVAVLFVIYALRQNNKGKQRYECVKDAAREAPVGARMIAIGNRDDIGPIGELVNRPFEPIIVLRTFSVLHFNLVLFTVIAINFAAAFLDSVPPILKGGGILAFALGFGAGQLAALLRPMYFRVVPGRLDILKFDGVRKKPLSIQRINLRNAIIHANFGFRTVEISNPLVEKKKLVLIHVSEPHRFVQGLFQAAICTTPAPPLPDDELLG
ncbi:MAG: hypothetical protein IPK83_07095 [Planctomycetes bacterium]|nr:hypothetical protein [Planctomycetota bacterium]